MNVWIAVYLLWLMLGLASALLKHGQTYEIKKPKVLFFSALSTGTLALGGMFSVWNGWLIAWCMFYACCIFVVLGSKDNTADHSFFASLIAVGINLWLLGKAGLFDLLLM